MLLGKYCMKLASHYIDEELIRKTIIIFIRPMLKYAATVRNPHPKKKVLKSSYKIGTRIARS